MLAQQRRLARFKELEPHVPAWRKTLESFVLQYQNLRVAEKALRSATQRHEKKLEFEKLHGSAYAKAAAADGQTRRRAATNKTRLQITENCPYCNGPLGDNPTQTIFIRSSRAGFQRLKIWSTAVNPATHAKEIAGSSNSCTKKSWTFASFTKPCVHWESVSSKGHQAVAHPPFSKVSPHIPMVYPTDSAFAEPQAVCANFATMHRNRKK